MRFTGPLTRRRREAIALAAREQINAATARMQRNVYRDHMRRIIAATAEVNEAVARSPHTDSFALQAAMGHLTSLCLMAQEYDTLQTTTDPTIQGN